MNAPCQMRLLRKVLFAIYMFEFTHAKRELIMRINAITLSVLFCLACTCFPTRSQSSAWSYQGHLLAGGQEATGPFDMTFRLFASDAGGSPMATVTNTGVSVSNGLFTTMLDFGGATFDGMDRWLEIAVQPNGENGFTMLSPRQFISSAPYAITAGQLTGALPSGFLAGTYSEPVALTNPSNTLAGDGMGLSNVTATTLEGLSASDFWQLGGNWGSADGTFLGTTNNEPLDMGINGEGILRIQPSVDGSPSIVGGSASSVTAGLSGATIGGGLRNTLRRYANESTIAGGSTNQITGHGSVIGGGALNTIGFGLHMTIAGGEQNTISGHFGLGSFMGGGSSHTINGSSPVHAVIVGGLENTMSGDLIRYSTIGGGRLNFLGNAEDCVITGGSSNRITSGGFPVGGVIGGGRANWLMLSALEARDSTIAGGFDNLVQSGFSTISGGSKNAIVLSSTGGSIGGGQSNLLSGVSTTISGGANNMAMNHGATVAGGIANLAVGTNAFVGGGAGNLAASSNAAICGGFGNNIHTNASDATIAGGSLNSIGTQSSQASIGGGKGNQVTTGTHAAIGGGEGNQVSAQYGTIPGGKEASARSYGQMAYASGQFASPGDAQTSTLVFRGTTTNGAPTELFLDGQSERMALPDNATWALDILVTARDSLGNSAAWRLLGAAQNHSGTTVMIAPPQKTCLGATFPGAWDVDLCAPATNGVLTIQATGADSTSIRWVANVRTVEVTY